MKLYVIHNPNESKFERFKREVRAKAHNAVEWFNNNKDTIALLTPVAIGGLTVITTIVKAVGKRSNLKKEEAVKEMYCYDPSLGHYWALKRKLSNAEWLSVDKRRKNGERIGEILEKLGVLK